MPAKIAGFRALGEALGIAGKQCHKHASSAGWPFSRTGPWPAAQIPKMRAWLAALPGRQSGDATEREAAAQKTLTTVKIAKFEADTRAKNLEVAIKAKRFHNAEECLRRRLNVVHRHKEDLYEMVDGLPMDEANKNIVRSGIDRLLEALSAGYAAPDPQ